MKHSNGRIKFLPARRIGVHANAPYCRPLIGFKRVIGWSIVALAVAVVIAYPLVIMQAANASVTPAAKTCAAFVKWDHARTTANLNTMMTVSESAPWKYTGEDASALYADVRGKAATKYVNSDIKYFGEDC